MPWILEFGPRRIPVHKSKKNQRIIIHIAMEYGFAAIARAGTSVSARKPIPEVFFIGGLKQVVRGLMCQVGLL
jgi:hypothetical protein